MKPVKKSKSVFIGNWSYSMPDTKENSDGHIVLILKLSFGPCEVYEWGIDNNCISEDKFCIDVKTSKELFGLMGGGIRINGEYVPVELTIVHEAILAQDDAPKH